MNSGSPAAAAALLARLKQSVEAGRDQFNVRPHEMLEAYGIWAETEILKDLGPGWRVCIVDKELIVTRGHSQEAAIRQIEHKLAEIVLSLG